MSENVDSYADEVPPEVYRRRRIVALLILVLLLLLIIGLVSALVNRGNDNSNATATASTSTSAEAFSDFSARATASATAEASESASDQASESATAEASETATAEPSEATSPSPEESTASETASPEPTETETSQALAACTAADLQISLTADKSSYAAGQNPALAVTYTNVSGNPCLVTGGANNVDINITSGPAQVYNYAQCFAQPVEDAEVAAGATNTTAISWNRSLNVLGCNTSATIQPGYYWATATVNGISSQPLRIIVNG